MIKVIIAGGRDFEGDASHLCFLDEHVPQGEEIEIVSGKADGADAFGEMWARYQELPVKSFPADWKRHGKRAGPIRNEQMAEYADHLIAFWDGRSRGTKSMINLARKKGLKVTVYQY